MFENSWHAQTVSTPSSAYVREEVLKEREIVADLIRMLLGIPSEIMATKDYTEKYELPHYVKMQHLGSETTHKAVEEATVMANHLKYIEK